MFTPDTFRFIEDLTRNNDRTWFGLNKHRYDEAVREPALAFIEGVAYPLRGRVSPHLRVTSSCLFRIHRDTRFSKDKTPYKTHVGMHFPLADSPMGSRSAESGVREDVHRPGYYLHLEPGHCFVGGGMWHPPTDALHQIRQAIVAREDEWAALRPAHELQGESLKRPPAGFPKDHRFVADLMRKDFVVSRNLTEEEICRADFIDRFVEECARTAPLMRFLCEALRLPWD